MRLDAPGPRALVRSVDASILDHSVSSEPPGCACPASPASLLSMMDVVQLLPTSSFCLYCRLMLVRALLRKVVDRLVVDFTQRYDNCYFSAAAFLFLISNI